MNALQAKIDTAIERICEFEPPEGYYGAFSGGKCSSVLKHVVEEAGVRVDWHFNKTTVDPPEVTRFIIENYPEVARESPEITMWKLIEKKGFPPTRRIRYCCQYLKERGGKDRRVLTGIRWAESHRRRQRGMVERCHQFGQKVFVNPIIDFTNEEVWQYTRDHDLPVCSLYQIQDRIGCVACPMAGVANRIAELARYPGYRKAYVRAFDMMLIARRERDRPTTWENGEQVMEWWLSK